MKYVINVEYGGFLIDKYMIEWLVKNKNYPNDYNFIALYEQRNNPDLVACVEALHYKSQNEGFYPEDCNYKNLRIV